MVKTTKVSVLSGSTTSETVRMKTSAANGGDLGSTTPRLLKLLTVFCVGQVIVVIVASIVVGVFLQSQTNEIEELKDQKRVLESKMGAFHEDMELLKTKTGNPTSTTFVQDYESRISQLETYRTSDRSIIEEQMERIVNLETNNAVIFNTLTQVEALTNRHNNSLSGNDERLIKVEEGMEIQDISIAELETTMTNIDTRIKHNETENTDMKSRITDLEIRVTSIETGIEEAEAELNGLETSKNETETRIKQTEEDITQLKTDVTEMKTKITNLEIRINDVESGMNETQSDMNSLRTNITETDTKINEIEIKYDSLNITLEKHSSLIANLESNTSSNQDEIFNHTLKITELETLLDAHISSKILQLESELAIHRADIDANLNRIKQLMGNLTAEKVMYQTQILFLQGLESDIASVQAMVSNQTDAINRVMIDAREQVRNQSEAINQLRIDVLEQNTSVHTCISGLRDLKSKQTLDEAALVNLNLSIAEVGLSLLLHNSTIQTQNDILQDLVVYMNDSQGILLDHSRELTDIKASTANVAFMAQLSPYSLTPVSGQTVAFDKVETNEGNAYNSTSGVFTAPRNGTYNFNVIASSPPVAELNQLHLFIMRNREQVGYVFLDDNDQYFLRRSTDITIHVIQGDEVYVKFQDNYVVGSAVLAGCCFHSHFTGFLIGPDYG